MAISVNKVILVGNITQEIELRTIPSGTPVARINLATNRSYRDRTTNELKTVTEFHRVVVWGKLAELCKQYLEKGRMIYVEGRLQTRSWQNQSGNKVSLTEVVAETVKFGPPRQTAMPGAGTPEAPISETALNEVIAQEDKTPQIDLEELPY